ncbi:MAG: hypothetical protein AABZ94_01555 [Candidatus Eisenbacteria bacterium]
MTLFARRVAGSRVGFLTGLLFAALGPFPLLIGWISGSQDLFAMVFIAAAIHFQLGRRTGAALVCTAAALLSKETTLFFLPAVATMGGVLYRDRSMLRKNVFQYATLGGLWAVLHPKVRAFVTHGVSTGEAGYVGMDNPHAAGNLVRELAALLNIPVGNTATHWPSELNLVAAAGVAIVLVAFWIEASVRRKEGARAIPRERALLFGLLLGVTPAVLTAASAKHWFPYYACMPAMGTSLLLAMGIEKLGWRFARAAAVGFLVLGVWSRGIDLGTRGTPTERNFRTISRNLGRVESELKKLHPWFPDSSRLHVTIQAPYDLSLHSHLLTLQAARVWYSNPTIQTHDPMRLRPGRGPEYLFWVTPSCDVFEITLDNLRVRSPGPRPDILDYQKALRSLAYGFFAANEVERATSVLLNMQEVDSLTWAFDRRLAATMLSATGRSSEAEELCARLPPLERGNALNAIAAVLGPVRPGTSFEKAAFRTFGVSEQDSEAYRFLMNYFSDQTQLTQAMRMAEKLISLRPDDAEAFAMIEAIRKVPRWEQVVVPVLGEGS